MRPSWAVKTLLYYMHCHVRLPVELPVPAKLPVHDNMDCIRRGGLSYKAPKE